MCAGCDRKLLFDQSVHTRKGVNSCVNNAALLRRGQRNRIKGRRKCAPVQSSAFGSPRQMTCAERLCKAELQSLLQEKGGAEVGAFRNVEPAERRRDVGRDPNIKGRRRIKLRRREAMTRLSRRSWAACVAALSRFARPPASTAMFILPPFEAWCSPALGSETPGLTN